jgi:hypothetical protein
MRSNVRISILAMVALATIAVLAPAAAQASFGVESFFAGTCTTNANCTSSNFYTQAAGHPNFGINDTTFNTFTDAYGQLAPDDVNQTTAPRGVAGFRVDLPPGLVINHQALPLCGAIAFLTGACAANTEEGTDTVTLYGDPLFGTPGDTVCAGKSCNFDFTLPGAIDPETPKVYNVNPTEAQTVLDAVCSCSTNPGPMPSLDGVYEPGIGPIGMIFGGFGDVSASGTPTAYHEFFTIPESSGPAPNPTPPSSNKVFGLIETRLSTNGLAGTGNSRLITLPSVCGVPSLSLVTTVAASSFQGGVGGNFSAPVVPAEGCGSVPFAPTASLTPSTTESGAPDGATVDVQVPQDPNPGGTDSSTVEDATFTLPAGMSLNPSAANGLEACTSAQLGIGTTKPVECPAESQVGTVTVHVPTLPVPLEGKVYLGESTAGPITGGPYSIFVVSESATYNVNIRLAGSVAADPNTGQLTATFNNLPDAPFSDFQMQFTSGAKAPLANPIPCGTAQTSASLVPFSSTTAASPAITPFTVDSNGAGGTCSTLFSLSQSTSSSSLSAGASSPFTFNLARADNQQYLSKVSTTLPAGLLGVITGVPLCQEPQASAGTCPTTSQIGTVTVTAGAGPSPATFSGPVSLTGPYGGGPYGLSMPVPTAVGPFNFGTIVTRAAINIDPYTARVNITGNLPTIIQGVPLRIKTLSIAVTRANYIRNPTNCGVLATESTLTSTLGATQSLSTPFQAVNCNALAFKPSFAASSGAKTSKANGASIETTINQPAGEANIKSVLVQLPRQLPSRLTTLQKACPEATFAANPYTCPSGSFVGGARANTPVLPTKMTGPAILVSHGGAAFPDLDLVLEADGVRVILVGNTNIKNGITTTNFKENPDVPVSSITVNLPVGPHSALAANGSLCAASPLAMPTTITGQNGKQVKQTTKIAVKGCPVEIVGKKVIGNTVFLTIKTFAAGRISGSGSSLSAVYRHLNSAQSRATLKVPLSSRGRVRGRPFRVRLRVGFVPKQKAPTSTAYTTVTFG